MRFQISNLSLGGLWYNFGGLFLAGALLFEASLATASRTDYFEIQVIDAATGRGVPLVELETVNHAKWWTDSNGIVAFDEPGLMGLEVYFHVRSPGYEMQKDGFGNRGVKLKATRGGHAVVKITRLNIAERLYRNTGQGIYRDSVLLGRSAPLKQAVLNGQVMGQDTVIATPYRGKIYWFWGDTDRPSYPLGNFSASGATSELPGHGGLDPGVGVDLTYFVDGSGFSKQMCPEPKQGLKWIESLMTVRDEGGVERLVARVDNVKDLGHAYGWDLMVFNDKKEIFESVQRWDIQEPHVSAHPFRAQVDGKDFYYIYPDFRVPAELKALKDLGAYETFTCVAGDGKWHGRETKVERDADGGLRYGWKAGAGHPEMRKPLQAGEIKAEEAWSFLRDFETGAALTRGLQSVAWNDFRRRWIAFFADKPGEAWFAEADTPLGPWGYARRVVTHGDYNFYNIAHHSFFNQEGGRLVYFEGTYTATFSKAEAAGNLTPRYNYNQLMYRLALDDARLALPVAVYRLRGANGTTEFVLREKVDARGLWEQIEEVAWFAMLPRADMSNGVPVYSQGGALAVSSVSKTPALFTGLPLDEEGSKSPNLAVLKEYRGSSGGARLYSIGDPPPDLESEGKPLCRVWKVPGKVLTMDWKARPVEGP